MAIEAAWRRRGGDRVHEDLAVHNRYTEQVGDNVKAAGVTLDDDVMKRIDDALGSVVVRDPKLTAENSPKRRAV